MTQPAIGDSKSITNNSLARTSLDSKQIAAPNPYKSPSTCLANMDSHKDVWPKSPSPICSSSSGSTSSLSAMPTCSPSSNATSFSRFLADQSSSTPRKQSFCTAWDCNKDSGMELDDHIKQANHLSCLFLSNMQHNYPQGNALYPSGSERISNFLQEYSDQPITRGTSEASDGGSPIALQRNSMTRLKPYSAFLDEIKKQEFEAEVEAWRRAKEEATMDRLRRKEALIREWEFRQTSKAMEEMKKYETKLENKRVKALERLQNRMSLTKAKADKKSRKAKRETMEKLSEISEVLIKARATKNLGCLKS